MYRYHGGLVKEVRAPHANKQRTCTKELSVSCIAGLNMNTKQPPGSANKLESGSCFKHRAAAYLV